MAATSCFASHLQSHDQIIMNIIHKKGGIPGTFWQPLHLAASIIVYVAKSLAGFSINL